MRIETKTDERGVEYVEDADWYAELPKGWVCCSTCHRAWDDETPTSVTPVPSGRCPFEDEHDEHDEQEEQENTACDCAIPGVLWPWVTDGDASHDWIERCDDCGRFETDEDAADWLGNALGVEARYARIDSLDRDAPYIDIVRPES